MAAPYKIIQQNISTKSLDKLLEKNLGVRVGLTPLYFTQWVN